MKTFKYEVTIYRFDELKIEAKTRALMDQAKLIAEMIDDSWEGTVYWAQVEKMESLQTPWFLAQAIYDECRNAMIRDFKANKDRFFASGKFFTGFSSLEK